MKPLVCVYSEGNDTKVAVVVKVDGKLSVMRTASVDYVQPTLSLDDSISGLKIEEGDFDLESVQKQDSSIENSMVASTINTLSEALKGVSLNKCLFIPALT